MGGHHAACGAAAWIALTSHAELPLTALRGALPWLPDSVALGAGLIDASPVAVVMGALVCAGAALLPDADHHNATIAHALPPFSTWLARGIGRLSGGHRHGTHSLLGILVFTLLSAVPQVFLWVLDAGRLAAPSWLAFAVAHLWPALCSVVLVAFAAKVLRFLPDGARKFPWVLGGAAGVLVAASSPADTWWFPLAVGVGVVVHLVGDLLTVGGVNLVWPLVLHAPRAVGHVPVLRHVWLRSGHVSLPLLGEAGSVREWLLLVPVSLYAVIGMTAGVVASASAGLALWSAPL